jgi:hypothetical protein
MGVNGTAMFFVGLTEPNDGKVKVLRMVARRAEPRAISGSNRQRARRGRLAALLVELLAKSGRRT